MGGGTAVAAAPASPGWVEPTTAASVGPHPRRWSDAGLEPRSSPAPTKLMFDFKADGTVTVERSANGRSQTLKGTWGTNGDKMRLQIPGGGEAIPFTVSATSAGFPFEDAKVNLKKQ